MLIWTWLKPPHAHSEGGTERTERKTTHITRSTGIPGASQPCMGMVIGVGSVNALLTGESEWDFKAMQSTQMLVVATKEQSRQVGLSLFPKRF